MKIGAAQIHSIKGDITKNIEKHISILKKGIAKKLDLIVFPELSITGYEPSLSKELAFELDDRKFIVFQELSNKNNLIICIGVPLKIGQNVKIAIIIFQPNLPRYYYCKQILHKDELQFFTAGNQQKFIESKGVKIALAICFESLQESHLQNALKENPQIYMASVAKSIIGVEKAYAHYSNMAKKYKIHVVMANCLGFCDNFESIGNSAVWDNNGDLLIKLEKQQDCIVCFDVKNNNVELIF